MLDTEKMRREREETRRKERVRDSLSLRGVPPEETLRIMFELCAFTQELRRAANENV